MITSVELSDNIKNMSIEDVLKQVHPLILKYANWKVPGFDFDDLYSELSVVVWNCYESYDRKKGSFINLLIWSFRNKLSNLRKTSVHQNHPIAMLKCAKCEKTARYNLERLRPKCPNCDIRMEIVRNGNLLFSIERRQEATSFDIRDDRDPIDLTDEVPEEADDYSWESTDAPWRAGLKKSEVKVVEHALRGEPLTDYSRETLQRVFPIVRSRF